MNKFFKITLMIHVFVFTLNTKAQDIHFSQFNEAPMILNPANAGMYSGDYRAVLNFKEQWSMIKNSYKTYAGSFDFILFKNNLGLKSTGIGVNFFQDIAGSSKTKTTRVDLNLSQTVYINTESDLTLGVGASYLDVSANYNGLLWASQWNGIEFDETLGSGESFNALGTKNFDLSAGLLYRNFDINGHPLQIGFSVFHLTQPKVGIIDINDNIPFKFTGHFDKEFNFPNSDEWGGQALGFASVQRTAREFTGGFLLRKDFGMVSKYTGYYKNFNLYFGALYRYNDAIIVMSKMLLYGSYSIGVSYDFNISPLVAATRYKGGFEISLSFNGLFKDYPVVSPKNLNDR